MAAYKLVLIRHGESNWNQENRFCGWFDADLSETGAEEAKRGSQALKEAGYEFDICYTSVLKRAIRTLWIVLDGIDQMWLPVHRTWRLNERHYGGLTGLNKAETAAKHGEAQVKIWRRSFDVPPPPMDSSKLLNFKIFFISREPKAGYEFDICYTSVLKRAIRTLWIVLDGIDQMWLPVHRTWRLNERHYGGLTGLNKAETAAKHGEAQVKIWRRSFDVPPPPMDSDHDYYTTISKDRRYGDLTEDQLPSCESLKDTIARALPFWNEEIVPQIKEGKRVLIAAHGNSLRGIVKHLEGMSEEAIMELNLPTGIPILYELDKNLKPVKPMQFLGNEETVRKAMEAVAAQGKAKK
ncbi:UNVERIFIED_CONTAM: hypothetical protein FKN15_021248 [Acipenser sinensis]